MYDVTKYCLSYTVLVSVVQSGAVVTQSSLSDVLCLYVLLCLVVTKKCKYGEIKLCGKKKKKNFFTGEIQQDACECLMLLIEIMDKGFGPCPTNDNINSKGSFSELLVSFVLEKYTICDICSMKSPAFENTSLLYVTPNDSSSMQELLMQEHKQKIYKTCFCCGRDIWHIESKQILQPPNYLIIIVNRITYSNNRITKNKSRMPLDLYIKLGPYKFSLQASVDHHGYSMNSGHYTASINCCGKHFIVMIIKLLNVISRILIIHLLPIYFCTRSCYARAAICSEGHLSLLALSSVYSLTVEDGSWSTPMVPAQLSVPLQQVEE